MAFALSASSDLGAKTLPLIGQESPRPLRGHFPHNNVTSHVSVTSLGSVPSLDLSVYSATSHIVYGVTLKNQQQ